MSLIFCLTQKDITTEAEEPPNLLSIVTVVYMQSTIIIIWFVADGTNSILFFKEILILL